ncbi:MAG: HAD family hydrolase [Spirochaetaceae bacterium]|nr:HAD family hydrolase [Spirochaetaceae bacterium]MCF7947326.1 HAD family hydrolase [Spirochaetia bacterium]MCF7950552.1 HAD family hydrolase [Spirochaetaceae bacterium]
MIKMIRKDINLSKIDFIFFDKGGTLSYQVPHVDDGIRAADRIRRFLGYALDPIEFRQILKIRNKKYKEWSLSSSYEETVENICVKWLFFDAPDKQLVMDNADRLLIMASYVKGPRIMYPESALLIKELRVRGYHLGLVSNTVSLSMVPQELQDADIYNDLDVIVMSSEERVRKPDPEIFLLACKRAGVSPKNCVYIGDAPNRDVEGPRLAGFYAVVIVKGEKYSPERDIGPLRVPDIVVDSLTDIYNLFPVGKVTA